MQTETNFRTRQLRQGELWVLIVGVVLMLVLFAACPLSLWAVQERMVSPPQLSVQVGRTEFSAPCPSRGIVCDESTPWFAVWRGDAEPDGSVTYRQLFFMYLKPRR